MIKFHFWVCYHILLSLYEKTLFQVFKSFIAIWNMFIVQKHCTEKKSVAYILMFFVNFIFIPI